MLFLDEWRFVDGKTYGAMPMAGMDPNYFTINGKVFPSTKTIDAKVGDRVRLRFIAVGQFVHPMHLHGFPFKIVATDGHPVPEASQLTKDTVLVAPWRALRCGIRAHGAGHVDDPLPHHPSHHQRRRGAGWVDDGSQRQVMIAE